MTFLSQTSFERKAVFALLLTSTTAAALLFGAVSSLAGFMLEQRRTLADMQAALAVIEGKGDLTTTPLGQAAKRLFTVRNASDFQSTLQSFVKDAAARHQGVIESIQVLKSERVGGLSRVALKLEGQIPEPKLGAFLADLATGQPLVLLQGMEIRPAQLQANRINNGGIAADAVQARIDVVAFSGAPLPATGTRGQP